MLQTAITIIILAAAFFFALRGIYRFIRKPEEIGCSPEKCARCSSGSDACIDLSGGGIPHKKNVSSPKLK